MNTKLAPIVIIGYSRAYTLRRSLSNLAKNEGLGDRDIYFFQDAPYREEDKPLCEEMYQAAVKARETLLPHLIIVRREKNVGVPGNLIGAVNEIMDKYGRLIFFEDDVLVSKTFVQYMDKALDFYKDDARIFCINGNTSAKIKVPKSYRSDLYLVTRNAAWGWASWKDRWEKVDFALRDWPSLRKDTKFLKKLHAAGCDLYNMAEGVFNGRIRTWDLQCAVHMVRNGLCSVAPKYNMTRNIGFGRHGGVNCRGNGRSRVKYYNFRPKMEPGLQLDQRVARYFPYASGEDRFWYRVIGKFRWWMRWCTINAYEEPIDIVGNG